MTGTEIAVAGVAVGAVAALAAIMQVRAVLQSGLKVKLTRAISVNLQMVGLGTFEALGVDVTCIGRIQLQVTEVGLKLSNPDSYLLLWPGFHPALDSHNSLPKRLKPRDSFLFVFPPILPNNVDVSRIVSGYARTSDGKRYFGRGKYLREYIKKHTP